MKMMLLSAMAMGAVMANAGEVKVTIASGAKPKPAVLRVGDLLTVRLDGNATTGYLWSAKAPSILKAGKTTYVAPKGHLAGAPGVQVCQFKAVKPGSGSLVFTYARPWEKGVKPIRSAQLQVTVKP